MAFPTTDLDVIVEAYLGADPTADPGTWPAATDLSSRLLRKPIQIRHGRGQNQKTAQAGACTLWLDNTDGALTPLLATSAYYPDWDFGVPLRVSVDNVGAFPPYVRHAGFVADITAVMVPGTGGRNISAVRVTSAGVLRRLGQGEVFQSPLRRAILTSSPLAYWPMEDGVDSTSIASALPSGTPIPATTTLTFTTGPAGSDGALDLVAGAAAIVATAHADLTSTTEFQVEFAAVSDQAALTLMLQIQATADGLSTNTGLSAASADGLPHYRAVSFTQTGGDVVVNFYVDGVFSSTSTFTSTTIKSDVDIHITAGNFSTGTVTLSHLSVRSTVSDSTTRAAAADGYAGEQAHVRIARICGEEGVPFSGTATSSAECGPQFLDDMLGLLRDSETVDHGMLIEDFAWGLNYRAMSQRYNLDPALTVDLSTYRTTAGTQGDVLTPVRTDARLRNEWTISRPDGSSAKASDAANIAKRGRFNDSATVNVVDDAHLPDEAAWRVHEGTFDGLRYETLPLDIAANL